MKATINGIEVEGTPEEVWALLQKSNQEGAYYPKHHPMPDFHGAWWGIFPPDTIIPRVTGGSSDTPDYLKWPKVVSWNGQTEQKEWDGHWRN